jgi:hypothetical protein
MIALEKKPQIPPLELQQTTENRDRPMHGFGLAEEDLAQG